MKVTKEKVMRELRFFFLTSRLDEANHKVIQSCLGVITMMGFVVPTAMLIFFAGWVIFANFSLLHAFVYAGLLIGTVKEILHYKNDRPSERVDSPTLYKLSDPRYWEQVKKQRSGRENAEAAIYS